MLEYQEEDFDDITKEVTEGSWNKSNSEDDDEDNDGGDVENAAVESRAYEAVRIEDTASQHVAQVRITRSDFPSKLHGHATSFPEAAHIQ